MRTIDDLKEGEAAVRSHLEALHMDGSDFLGPTPDAIQALNAYKSAIEQRVKAEVGEVYAEAAALVRLGEHHRGMWSYAKNWQADSAALLTALERYRIATQPADSNPILEG